MLQKQWPVLIVDDEPDVLAVTDLVLKGVRVDPVRTRNIVEAAAAVA